MPATFEENVLTLLTYYSGERDDNAEFKAIYNDESKSGVKHYVSKDKLPKDLKDHLQHPIDVIGLRINRLFDIMTIQLGIEITDKETQIMSNDVPGEDKNHQNIVIDAALTKQFNNPEVKQKISNLIKSMSEVTTSTERYRITHKRKPPTSRNGIFEGSKIGKPQKIKDIEAAVRETLGTNLTPQEEKKETQISTPPPPPPPPPATPAPTPTPPAAPISIASAPEPEQPSRVEQAGQPLESDGKDKQQESKSFEENVLTLLNYYSGGDNQGFFRAIGGEDENKIIYLSDEKYVKIENNKEKQSEVDREKSKRVNYLFEIMKDQLGISIIDKQKQIKHRDRETKDGEKYTRIEISATITNQFNEKEVQQKIKDLITLMRRPRILPEGEARHMIGPGIMRNGIRMGRRGHQDQAIGKIENSLLETLSSYLTPERVEKETKIDTPIVTPPAPVSIASEPGHQPRVEQAEQPSESGRPNTEEAPKKEELKEEKEPLITITQFIKNHKASMQSSMFSRTKLLDNPEAENAYDSLTPQRIINNAKSGIMICGVNLFKGSFKNRTWKILEDLGVIDKNTNNFNEKNKKLFLSSPLPKKK